MYFNTRFIIVYQIIGVPHVLPCIRCNIFIIIKICCCKAFNIVSLYNIIMWCYPALFEPLPHIRCQGYQSIMFQAVGCCDCCPFLTVYFILFYHFIPIALRIAACIFSSSLTSCFPVCPPIFAGACFTRNSGKSFNAISILS